MLSEIAKHAEKNYESAYIGFSEVPKEKFYRINTGLPDCLIVDNFWVINHVCSLPSTANIFAEWKKKTKKEI